MAKRYDGTTALAAVVRGGVALAALSTDPGTTVEDDFHSICTNVHRSHADKLPGSLFACFYEHLLLQHEPLDISTTNAEGRYLDLVGGIFLALARPDIIELFVLVVGLVFMWARHTPGVCFIWSSRISIYHIFASVVTSFRVSDSISTPSPLAIGQMMAIEEPMVNEEPVTTDGPAHDEENLLVEPVPAEEPAPILAHEPAEESMEILAPTATQQDTSFTTPIYGPDEFRFDKGRWIHEDPLGLEALQAAQEYTPPQTPLSMLSLGYAETPRSSSPSTLSVEEAKARADALIARFEWETHRRHEAISDVLAKYHGFYAGGYPHMLPEVVRPVPVPAPLAMPALRQIPVFYPAPRLPAAIARSVVPPPSSEPQLAATPEPASNLSTPPPETARPASANMPPAPAKLRPIAVFTAPRAPLPRRVR